MLKIKHNNGYMKYIIVSEEQTIGILFSSKFPSFICNFQENVLIRWLTNPVGLLFIFPIERCSCYLGFPKCSIILIHYLSHYVEHFITLDRIFYWFWKMSSHFTALCPKKTVHQVWRGSIFYLYMYMKSYWYIYIYMDIC